MGPVLRIIIAIAASFGAGLVTLYAVGPQALQWYTTLAKPALALPAGSLLPLFVGTFALMSLSLAVCWLSDPSHSPHDGWMRFYFILLLFSLVWLFLFFGLHALIVAFVDMLFCAFIIGALVAGAWEVDRRASYLLAPVFLFAIYLAFINLNIWFLS